MHERSPLPWLRDHVECAIILGSAIVGVCLGLSSYLYMEHFTKELEHEAMQRREQNAQRATIPTSPLPTTNT